MGLKEYRLFKKKSEFLSFLSEYGISEQDLKYIPEALNIVKKGYNAPVKPTDEEKQAIKKKNDKSVSIEDIVSSYSGEVEEFYPDGKK